MILKPLAYLWAFPTTCLGLVFLPPTLWNGKARVVDGVLELHGRTINWFLTRCTLLEGGASAMTLGHVVLGRDEKLLEQTRAHERVHVRQCERWGPLFIPAYLLASFILWRRGGAPIAIIRLSAKHTTNARVSTDADFGYNAAVSEVPKTDQAVQPPTPHVGVQLARLLVGMVWVLVIFGTIAGAIYLAWPWIMTMVDRFYN